MNDLTKVAFLIIGVIGFLLYINLICYVVSWWSGWRTLARRFAAADDFRAQLPGWHSSRMRWGAHYNNALKIGADQSGLHLSTIAIVPQHPSLLIPWTEIILIRRQMFFAWTFITFHLGREERIPFTISQKLVRLPEFRPCSSLTTNSAIAPPGFSPQNKNPSP